MATYIDNNHPNITFNRIHKFIVSVGSKISAEQYVFNDDDELIYKANVINAIDIDWNNAYLPKQNVYINSTADLLNQLEVIYDSIGNYDFSEFVTKDELEEKGYITLENATNTFAPISLVSELATTNEALGIVESTLDTHSGKINTLEHSVNDILDTIGTIEDSIAGYAESITRINGDINELTGLVSGKADLSDIPTSIYQLNGYDEFATIVYVNQQIAANLNKTPYDVYYEIETLAGRTPLGKEAWLTSLKGKDGTNGKSAYEIALEHNPLIGSESAWLNSLRGDDGKSAYILAIEHGQITSDISEEEWVASLQGTTGATGAQGKSAWECYKDVQIASGKDYLDEEEWVASLNGAPGETGAPGKSAWECYRDIKEALNLPYLDEPTWIASLNGAPGETGAPGKSAWECYRDVQIALGKDYLDEEEWVESFTNGKTYTAGKGISISENDVISVAYNADDVWYQSNDAILAS